MCEVLWLDQLVSGLIPNPKARSHTFVLYIFMHHEFMVANNNFIVTYLECLVIYNEFIYNFSLHPTKQNEKSSSELN